MAESQAEPDLDDKLSFVKPEHKEGFVKSPENM